MGSETVQLARFTSSLTFTVSPLQVAIPAASQSCVTCDGPFAHSRRSAAVSSRDDTPPSLTKNDGGPYTASGWPSGGSNTPNWFPSHLESRPRRCSATATCRCPALPQPAHYPFGLLGRARTPPPAAPHMRTQAHALFSSPPAGFEFSDPCSGSTSERQGQHMKLPARQSCYLQKISARFACMVRSLSSMCLMSDGSYRPTAPQVAGQAHVVKAQHPDMDWHKSDLTQFQPGRDPRSGTSAGGRHPAGGPTTS